MKSLQLLSTLANSTKEINNILQKELLTLTNDQLCWKPNEKSWSIIDCLEHIVLSGNYYLKEINKKFDKLIPSNNPIDILFKPGIIGNYLTRSMEPKEGNIKVKMKTLKRMKPGKSQLEPDRIIKYFLNYQEEILFLLDRSRYFNLGKIKISSSLGIFIRFRLGNAFKFVIAHNQRHIQQAKNVMKYPGFPDR